MSKPATSAVQRGIHHQEKGRYAEAKKCYEKALKERPDNIAALVNLGVTLHQLQQTKKGLQYIDKALALQPKHGDIIYNKAELLRQSKDYEAALSYYQQVAQLQKPTGMHLYHMGCCLEAMRRDEEALLCYTQAFELKQDARFACQAGDLLLQRGEIPIARACYESAVKYDPQHAKAYFGMALTYKRENEMLERQYLEQALQADPQNIKARASLFFSKLNLCDWTHYQTERTALTRILQEALRRQEPTISGFDCMVLQVNNELSFQVAKMSIPAIERMNRYANRVYTFAPRHHPRLRIGYVSSDFNYHPISQLIKNLFYYHNRETVEVYLYSHGINDGSEYRKHIEATAEHFIECHQWSDVAIADKIYQDEIDILIDLN
jgi:predicted O-linked N-acetylglucosamine transferase (SPINDLY family)